MAFNQKKFLQLLLSSLTGFYASTALSDTTILSAKGHGIIQLGGYLSDQGQTQHINIQDLIGDEFTVTHPNSSNGVVGLGYFFNGQEKPLFNISYGVNAFYLAKTGVTGNVIQENLFTNLSYHYNLTHYPVYAMAKSTIKTKLPPRYALAIDAGIGPNFIRADGFKERALDGITQPDRMFSSHTSTTFSATASLSIKIDQFFGTTPLECGYRFFYLGQGNFNVANDQVLNTLSTGNNYANAIMCGIMI